MAVDTAPKLRRLRVLAAKIETTTGTPISCSAADAVAPTFDPEMKYDIPLIERQQQGGTLSPIIQALGPRSVTLTYENELVGSGGSGLPNWTDRLLGCGLQLNGTTFSPLTHAITTLTHELYLDGRKKLASGCMGNVAFTLKNGEKGRVKFNFRGVAQPPTDTAILAPTYTTMIAPRCGATAFTIGATTYRVDEIEIDLGNVVILRPDMTALDSNSQATGFRAAYITGRKPTVRINPEALPLSTTDWYNIHRSSTTAALSCIVGGTANNIITFAAGKLQLMNPPQDGDRDGLMLDELEFLCTRIADAGDDELTIGMT
jgi:hypothetical protein